MNSKLLAPGNVHPCADPLTRSRCHSTVELFHDKPVSSGLRKLIQPGQTPIELLDVLLLNKQFTPAITVLAHALPGREAILWCCLAIEELAGQKMPQAQRWAFNNCIRWVMKPVETLRLVVSQVDESLESTTVALVSQAIQQCGEQIEAELKDKEAEARQGPLPRLVAAAINQLTLSDEARNIIPHRRCAIAIGIGVARGIYRFAH